MNFGIVIAIALAIYAYVQQSSSADSADPSSPTDSIFPAAVDALTGVDGAGEILSAAAPTAVDSITQIFQGVSDTVSGVFDGGVDAVVKTIADAIQKHEGYYLGSRSYRNNNPGNLRISGDRGTDAQGFGIFSTYELGRAALESDIRAKLRKYPSFSIYDMMARYAPPSENDTTTYANVIAGALGVPVTTKLSQLG